MNRFFVIICLILSHNLFGQISFEDMEPLLFDSETIYGTSILGPSISFFDYDNDGWDDITIPASDSNDFQFFKNVQGSFEKQNLSITSNGSQVRQAIWVDFDNDGDNDFFATSDVEERTWLYRNDGDNNFVDITSESGLSQESVPYWGASWGDYDNDSFLDVFISIRDITQELGNFLFRNNGNGTFTNVTVSSGISTEGQISFCSSFFDYDNDGDQDIYIANDKDVSPNVLYKNNGDGTFSDFSIVSGTNLAMSAMSTTIEDYNNDGWLDIYITNVFPPFLEDATIGNAFLHNNGDGTFTNIALENGTRFDSIGWGAVFLDVSNNTHKDLYVSGSEIVDSGTLSAALYVNDGQGNFTIPSNIGFEEDYYNSYSNAIGDIENDGLQDIVVINATNTPISLWNNKTVTSNNWIKIKLEGTTSNRMGIGSTIKVGAGDNVYYAYTLCGEGYMGQNSGTEFFGLDQNTIVDYIEVTWLSGITDRIENIDINQTITIIEGSNPLDIESFSNESFIIYPNPTTNQVTIETSEIPQRANLTILNMNGNVIKTYDFDNFQSQMIDVSNLSTGMYFIQFETRDKAVSKKMIIR